MFTDKFMNMQQIMEELKKLKIGFGIILETDQFDVYDGMIRENYGLKSIGRRLIVWTEVGGIVAEFDGYNPLNGGNVVYMVN